MFRNSAKNQELLDNLCSPDPEPQYKSRLLDLSIEELYEEILDALLNPSKCTFIKEGGIYGLQGDVGLYLVNHKGSKPNNRSFCLAKETPEGLKKDVYPVENIQLLYKGALLGKEDGSYSGLPWMSRASFAINSLE